MVREQISNDLDRAVNSGLIRKPYNKHRFTLRTDYIFIHVAIYCNEYKWGSGMYFQYSNSFSTMIRIPTNEYSYRRLANEIRKARKKHDKDYKE